MAVSKDTATSNTSNSVQQTIDINFTPGGGSDMVICAAHFQSTAGALSTGVTYDPGGGDEAAFTEIASVVNVENLDNALYILKDTAIVKSTQKVIRATASTSGTRHGIAVISFTGVDQTTPNDAATTDSDSTTNNTTAITITSAVDDMVIATLMFNTNENVVPSGSAVTWDSATMPSSTNTYIWDASLWAGAATRDMGWDWDASTRKWGVVACNLNAVAAAAGGIRNPMGGPTILRNPMGMQ